MSRIGKKPIQVPDGVTVSVSASRVTVNGPKGELTVPVARGIDVRQEDGNVIVERAADTPEHRAMHGLQRLVLARALLADPEVLVLVEPTSAVDAHTEARIARRLRGHGRRRL